MLGSSRRAGLWRFKEFESREARWFGARRSRVARGFDARRSRAARGFDTRRSRAVRGIRRSKVEGRARGSVLEGRGRHSSSVGLGRRRGLGVSRRGLVVYRAKIFALISSRWVEILSPLGSSPCGL